LAVPEQRGRRGGDDMDLVRTQRSRSLGRRRSVGPLLCTIHEGDEPYAPLFVSPLCGTTIVHNSCCQGCVL
jgi:hypothetical protein